MGVEVGGITPLEMMRFASVNPPRLPSKRFSMFQTREGFVRWFSVWAKEDKCCCLLRFSFVWIMLEMRLSCLLVV